MLLTFQDRLRIPWRGGAKQVWCKQIDYWMYYRDLFFVFYCRYPSKPQYRWFFCHWHCLSLLWTCTVALWYAWSFRYVWVTHTTVYEECFQGIRVIELSSKVCASLCFRVFDQIFSNFSKIRLTFLWNGITHLTTKQGLIVLMQPNYFCITERNSSFHGHFGRWYIYGFYSKRRFHWWKFYPKRMLSSL